MNASKTSAILRAGSAASSGRELFGPAVGAINGCGICIDAHQAVPKKAGATAEAI